MDELPSRTDYSGSLLPITILCESNAVNSRFSPFEGERAGVRGVLMLQFLENSLSSIPFLRSVPLLNRHAPRLPHSLPGALGQRISQFFASLFGLEFQPLHDIRMFCRNVRRFADI